MFNLSEPLLRRKQKDLDLQDLCGLLQINWSIGNKTLFCNVYTRIDQVFIVWAVITALIFITAQFCPISWQFQGILWSVVSIIGTGAMIHLSNFWVSVERLRWLIYLWASLMLIGVFITNIGIFCLIPSILMNLCPLWLGLSAIGYLVMGLGMKSKTFIISGVIHLLAINLLTYVTGWQFFVTGLIMSSCLFLLAELQWDMRPALDSDFLTPQQQEFNRQQRQLRQLKS